MDRKILAYLLILLIFSNCAPNRTKTLEKIRKHDIQIGRDLDVDPIKFANDRASEHTYIWSVDLAKLGKDKDNLLYVKPSNFMPIEMLNKHFELNTHTIIDLDKNITLDYAFIFLYIDSTFIEEAFISYGQLYQTIQIKDNYLNWKKTLYDKKGNLSKIYNIASNKDLVYLKGCGLYEDYSYSSQKDTIITKDTIDRDKLLYRENYFDEKGLLVSFHSKILNDSTVEIRTNKFYIKEEGNIKNNYKVGEWKYYNSDGSVRETKTYKLKDKVDIRFPFCLFNKVEPCFCDEKNDGR